MNLPNAKSETGQFSWTGWLVNFRDPSFCSLSTNMCTVAPGFYMGPYAFRASTVFTELSLYP